MGLLGRINPVPGFNFQVVLFDAPNQEGGVLATIGGIAGSLGTSFFFGAFSEVNGLTSQLDVEEYREGGRNATPHKFVKYGKYPNLTLKRGVTFNTDLADWYYQTIYGTGAPRRKNGVVILYDRGGIPEEAPTLPVVIPGINRTPVAIWFFRNGLPEKLDGPTLNAKSNEIAIESVEIVHEGLIRVGPGIIPGAGDVLAAVGI